MNWARLSTQGLATWFWLGKAPVAPGTFGSIGAVPLHLALSQLGPLAHAAVVVATAAVGVWVSQRESDYTGQGDPQHVVIDEVAGTLIAMGLVRGHGLWAQLAALVLFRLLDIYKPGPIRRLERVKPAGFGIMLDDLAAGLGAGALARLLP